MVTTVEHFIMRNKLSTGQKGRAAVQLHAERGSKGEPGPRGPVGASGIPGRKGNSGSFYQSIYIGLYILGLYIYFGSTLSFFIITT